MFFFITQIYDNENITRYDLYKIASKMTDEDLNIKKGKDKSFITKIYKDSATLLFDMEKHLLNKSDEDDVATFENLYNNNRKRMLEDSFREYVEATFLEEYKKMKKRNFKYLFNLLLQTIVDYQNKAINGFLDYKIRIPLYDAIESSTKHYNKVFLSYTINDKGLTLALFYYFYINGIFLYVDWMHSPALPTGKEIKKSIIKELQTSDQFLFLRTSNSELNIYGGNTIKQWCAWEIGNYYSIKKDEKYYLNFYETSGIRNKLLDTFKPMKGIEKGKIVTFPTWHP